MLNLYKLVDQWLQFRVSRSWKMISCCSNIFAKCQNSRNPNCQGLENLNKYCIQKHTINKKSVPVNKMLKCDHENESYKKALSCIGGWVLISSKLKFLKTLLKVCIFGNFRRYSLECKEKQNNRLRLFQTCMPINMPIGMSICMSIGECRTQKSGVQRRLLKMNLKRNFCRQLCCKRFNKGETFCWYNCPVVWSATCTTRSNNIVQNYRQAMRANDSGVYLLTILWMKCMPLMLIQLTKSVRKQPVKKCMLKALLL